MIGLFAYVYCPNCHKEHTVDVEDEGKESVFCDNCDITFECEFVIEVKVYNVKETE